MLLAAAVWPPLLQPVHRYGTRCADQTLLRCRGEAYDEDYTPSGNHNNGNSHEDKPMKRRRRLQVRNMPDVC
jgi:hypothetical protein